jgi:hypothetical protein
MTSGARVKRKTVCMGCVPQTGALGRIFYVEWFDKITDEEVKRMIIADICCPETLNVSNASVVFFIILDPPNMEPEPENQV